MAKKSRGGRMAAAKSVPLKDLAEVALLKSVPRVETL